ncbi:hypothetical protein HPB52_008193 [Rhipicephalus sanguineus]|uniref:Endonuclease/exonuclease/phosphatase domain-containing protein n=1 Tax=Rhipicephalus sanguineus TaxID=34632 RepID=A0A9D4PV87_RHISA|nr:hypothetical protein HPB52_008193 [Rhipicephalus sanguineus]
MDDIMSKVSQVVQTTVTQLLQTGFQTLKSEMENQIRALETKMTQSGESFSQRIHTLEERENARKKPNDGKKRTAILTKKTINAQQHCIHHRIEHTLVEIVPEKKHQQSLFVLNVYSPPKDHLKDLDKLMREVKKLSKGNGLIVVGDFNAPHVAWGYTASKKKGEDMHNVAQHHHLTLLNDPQYTHAHWQQCIKKHQS